MEMVQEGCRDCRLDAQVSADGGTGRDSVQALHQGGQDEPQRRVPHFQLAHGACVCAADLQRDPGRLAAARSHYNAISRALDVGKDMDYRCWKISKITAGSGRHQQ